MYLELKDKDLVRKETTPDLPDSGIDLETTFCGICGSDKHRIQKGSGYILGHENVAQVADDSGERFSRGDFVAVNPLIPCGDCNMCQKNQSNICKNLSSLGKDLPGGFSSKITAPEDNLYKINENSRKYVLADPLAVVIHACRQVELSDKNVLVIGDGALGALTCVYISGKVQEIHLKGRNGSKIEKITQNTDAVEELDEEYDLIFEAVGGEQSETLNTAAKSIGKRGDIIVYGVFPNKELELNLRPAFEKEARLLGVNSYRNDEDVDDFKEALDFIKTEKLDFLVETLDPEVEEILKSFENSCIKSAIKY